MPRGARPIAGLLLVIASWSPGLAAWAPVGPDGGDVDALAIDPSSPSKLYAGTSAGGLFASTDGAATWHGVDGPVQKSVRVIAVAPSAGSIVYAGVGSGPVRKSVD